MKSMSRPLALSALSAALGTVLLYVSSILPSGRLTVLCVASLCTVVVQCTCGWKWALGSFAVTAALSLILLPGKAVAVLYAVLFGYYPLVMLIVGRIKSPAGRWAIKLGLFNAVVIALYYAARSLLQSGIGSFFIHPLIMLLLANGLFILYDLALQQGILYFMRHIARRIK